MAFSDLRNKVVFISGASSGIGEGTALQFASLGCNVVLNGRNLENLKRVAELCIGRGLRNGQVLIAQADLRSESEVRNAIQMTTDTFKKLDVLVNNAGIVKYGTIEDSNMNLYDDMMDSNLRSAVLLTKYAVPHLIRTKGCIVNVSSISSIVSLKGELFYAMAKAAMDQLTKCTSMELAAKGVRVNSVNPAVVDTDIFRRSGMTESVYQEYLDAQNTMHPLGRYGRVNDIASAIVFLASQQASWITGAILPVDGGRVLAQPMTKKNFKIPSSRL